MKRTRIAAFALASALLALPAGAATVEHEWWNVDFSDPPVVVANNHVYGGFPFTLGELGALTNNYDNGGDNYQPYASGLWTADPSDESFVTNGVTTNFVNGVQVVNTATNYLELNTQGNDLTWTPTNALPNLPDVFAITNVTTLVDADLYLVGSDSAPDASDFDPASAQDRVQTAIYLKNEIDADSGDTTNSVLCVYARALEAEGNAWLELDGDDLVIEDNSWHHVRVEIVYKAGVLPKIHVTVDDKDMYVRGSAGSTADKEFTAANAAKARDAGRVKSVSFRGTGKIDNFVAKTVEVEPTYLDLTAEVYFDGELVPADAAATGFAAKNKTVVKPGELVESGSTVEYTGFWFEDAKTVAVTWNLAQVDVITPAGGTETYTYTYVPANPMTRLVLDQPNGNPVVPDVRAVGVQSLQQGSFKLIVPTEGFETNTTVAKLYFVTRGAYNADAVTEIGGNVSTNSTIVKPSEVTGGNTKALSWTFNDTEGGYVLRTLATTAAVSYENGVVTVSTNLSAALEADTTFVTATYVEGSYAGKTPQLIDNKDGTYTIGSFVAKIGSTPYESLREALDHAVAGDTIVMVADDRVSFTADAPELAIGFKVTIDGGSKTLYGLSNYAPPSNGTADHDIYIYGSDAVTIKNLTLSGFSDAAPVAQRRTNPIWVGQRYTGELTLDGVTVTNFNRTAFNLGGGTFVITNCVIAGCYAPEMEGECFQSAIEVFNANGTVAETTVTGVGSTIERAGSSIASCFTLQSDADQTPWVGGTGSITVLSGFYAGEYIGLGMTNAEGRILIEGGTFVASAPADDEAFGLNGEPSAASVAISGGWFDRPPTNYLASADLAAVDYGTEAPDQRATWTVEVPKVQIDFYVDGDLYVRTNVLAGTTAAGYAPADPTKASTAEFDYSFDWWTNAVGDAYMADQLPDADEDAAYYAVFTEETRKYWISWVVDETTTSNEVEYGTVPVYAGTPEKPSTETTVYEFAGWDVEPVAVVGEATYTATWTEKARPCAIKFWAGTEQEGDDPFFATNAPYGTTGYGPTNTPAKAATAQFTYEFVGWTNAAVDGAVVPTADLPAVAGEADWTAVFTETTNAYDVIWVVEGSDPVTNRVAYGVVPAYEGTPARESTVGTNFTFAGWSPEVVAVTEDAIYTATWTEELRKYWISWVVDGTTTSNEVDYGTAPSYGPDPEKENYTFLGWATAEGATAAEYGVGVALPEVGGEAKYYAVFEENAPEHIGAAAAENGFMILAPEDPTQPEAPVFTMAPAMNGLNGATRISASFVKPDGVTSATVKLVYKKSLAADAQKFYVDATITNIDLENGTADVAYTLPQDEPVIFLVGFTDGEPAGNGD